MPSVILLSAVYNYCYTECRYVECRGTVFAESVINKKFYNVDPGRPGYRVKLLQEPTGVSG
jgi:hypothetical protein